MTNLEILLVFVSNLAPTNFSFFVFEMGLVSNQIFSMPVSNLTIISHNAIFGTKYFP